MTFENPCSIALVTAGASHEAGTSNRSRQCRHETGVLLAGERRVTQSWTTIAELALPGWHGVRNLTPDCCGSLIFTWPYITLK